MATIRSVLKELGEGTHRLVENSKGYDHKTYLVHTPKKKFVVKIPLKEQNKLVAESYSFRKWRALGLPVPKIIKVTDEYIVEERIPGADMEDSKLSLTQKKNILYQLGKYMKKMHRVKTRGFGYIHFPGRGCKNSWSEFVKPDWDGCIQGLRKKKVLSKSLLSRMEKVFEQNKDFLLLKSPRLVHADCTDDNIMLVNGKISGIIDAGDAMSGDPMCDLAVTHKWFFDPRLTIALLDGYGRHNIKKVYFYALATLAWTTLSTVGKRRHASEKRKLLYYLKKLEK